MFKGKKKIGLPIITFIIIWAYNLVKTFKIVAREGKKEENHNILHGFSQTKSSNHAEEKKQNSHKLPNWVRDYFEWHNEMRKKFPGKLIIEDKNAPKILMRTCIYGLCGGLHDRLGQLPLDLYIANQTNRILLIYWLKPSVLEEFLIPYDLRKKYVTTNIDYSIDWTLPASDIIGTTGKRRSQIGKLMKLPRLISNVVKDRREKVTMPFETLLDDSLFNLTKGTLKDEKIVTFEILGSNNEDYLEKKLQELGETDMIHNTFSFGQIFQSFFQPSPAVMQELDVSLQELELVPKSYTAIHSRVRHPGGYSKGQEYNGIYAAKADRYIPEFVGEFKDKMIETAIDAIICAETLSDNNSSKAVYYFMSDMSDLVTYLAFNISDENYFYSHYSEFSNTSSIHVTAKKIVSRHFLKARKQIHQNLHVDKARPTEINNYYASFVDLWIGIMAKCVVYGIGNYARFAAKISHTDCYLKYQRQKYGAEVNVDQSKFCKFSHNL